MYALAIIVVCGFKVDESETDFKENDLTKFQTVAIVIYTILFIGLFVALIMLRYYLKEKNAIF